MRVIAAAVALLLLGCASPVVEPRARVDDPYSTQRPSSSSVLFPGEHRGLRVDEVWRLPES